LAYWHVPGNLPGFDTKQTNGLFPGKTISLFRRNSFLTKKRDHYFSIQHLVLIGPSGKGLFGTGFGPWQEDLTYNTGGTYPTRYRKRNDLWILMFPVVEVGAGAWLEPNPFHALKSQDFGHRL